MALHWKLLPPVQTRAGNEVAPREISFPAVFGLSCPTLASGPADYDQSRRRSIAWEAHVGVFYFESTRRNRTMAASLN
jgi:hypothetical protein